MTIKRSNALAGLLAAATGAMIFLEPQNETQGVRSLVLVTCLLFIWFPDRIDGAFASLSGNDQNPFTRHVRTPNSLLSGFAWVALVGVFLGTVF